MEKMRELGDLDLELRCTKPFLSPHEQAAELGSQPQNFLALTLPSLLGCPVSHLTSLTSVISYK